MIARLRARSRIWCGTGETPDLHAHVAVTGQRIDHHVGAEPGRQRAAVLEGIDRHDPVGARRLRQLHREEPDRAEPEDRHAVTELDPGVAHGQGHHQRVETDRRFG